MKIYVFLEHLYSNSINFGKKNQWRFYVFSIFKLMFLEGNFLKEVKRKTFFRIKFRHSKTQISWNGSSVTKCDIVLNRE